MGPADIIGMDDGMIAMGSLAFGVDNTLLVEIFMLVRWRDKMDKVWHCFVQSKYPFFVVGRKMLGAALFGSHQQCHGHDQACPAQETEPLI